MKIFSICSSPIKGNAFFVQHENTNILLDAGFTQNTWEQALSFHNIDPKSIQAILLTHGHDPHCKGIKWVIETNPSIEVYASQSTLDLLLVPPTHAKPIQSRNVVTIGSITVFPFPVKHFIETFNYVLETNDTKLAYITNTGHIDKQMIDDIGKCQNFLIEAYYHPGIARRFGKWDDLKHIVVTEGHLTNEDASEIIARCTAPQLNNIILCNVSHYNQVNIALLTIKAMIDNPKIRIHVAPSHHVSPWIDLHLEKESFIGLISSLPPKQQQNIFDKITKL